MKIDTKLTKISRNVKKQKGFINPGIYKGSTMIFNSFEDYVNDIKNDDDRTTLYGINKNPSVDQLKKAITNLYNLSRYYCCSFWFSRSYNSFFSFFKKKMMKF
jgi:Cystathionine beta-lyases/cystathionine gamma-synthases